MLNPFPLDPRRRAAGRMRTTTRWTSGRRSGRAATGRRCRSGSRGRSRTSWFNKLFAALPSDRDRALVAFWISTGARASELLGMRQCDFDPGEQLISVVRKGTRAVQQLPASADAFVWLRLYQQELLRRGPAGPAAAGVVDAAPAVSAADLPRGAPDVRAGQRLARRGLDAARPAAQCGARMARDPELRLTDVQWVMGHAHLTTTEIYLTPTRDEVIEGVLAHHARQSRGREAPAAAAAPGYDPQSLAVLFGRPL